jgi:hypothetical protein
VNSEGFTTTVHPAAKAGAILRESIENGKFQEEMAATTSAGSRVTRIWLPRQGEGTISPLMRRASSANHCTWLARNRISFRASASGLPCSSVSIAASSSTFSRMIAAIRCRAAARSAANVFDQRAKGACAASAAALASAAPDRAMAPMTLPVDGSATVAVLPVTVQHQTPPIALFWRSQPSALRTSRTSSDISLP